MVHSKIREYVGSCSTQASGSVDEVFARATVRVNINPIEKVEKPAAAYNCPCELYRKRVGELKRMQKNNNPIWRQ